MEHISKYLTKDIKLSSYEDKLFKSDLMFDDHMLVWFISGETKIIQAESTFSFKTGDIFLIPRLIPYFDLESEFSEHLSTLKIEEAINILRLIEPSVDGILANFDVRSKVDLIDFMQRNFMFKMSLEKLGYWQDEAYQPSTGTLKNCSILRHRRGWKKKGWNSLITTLPRKRKNQLRSIWK